MEHTRIALVDRPSMLRDLVERALAEVDEAKIVARLNPEDLPSEVKRADADIAIACAPSDEQSEFLMLITAQPRLKALAVVGDGESAVSPGPRRARHMWLNPSFEPIVATTS